MLAMQMSTVVMCCDGEEEDRRKKARERERERERERVSACKMEEEEEEEEDIGAQKSSHTHTHTYIRSHTHMVGMSPCRLVSPCVALCRPVSPFRVLTCNSRPLHFFVFVLTSAS